MDICVGKRPTHTKLKYIKSHTVENDRQCHVWSHRRSRSDGDNGQRSIVSETLLQNEVSPATVNSKIVSSGLTTRAQCWPYNLCRHESIQRDYRHRTPGRRPTPTPRPSFCNAIILIGWQDDIALFPIFSLSLIPLPLCVRASVCTRTWTPETDVPSQSFFIPFHLIHALGQSLSIKLQAPPDS